MANTPDIPEKEGEAYVCKMCEGQFIIPQSETTICCPTCRVNRISLVD